MVKKSRRKTGQASRGQAFAPGEESSAAEAVELPAHDVGDRIRSALKLHDLQSIGELGERLSKYQESVAETVKSTGLSENLAACESAIDKVRTSLRLPIEQLDQIALQTSKAAAVVSEQFAHRQDVRDLARMSARLLPANGDRSPAQPPPQLGRTNDEPATTTLASTRDLGRLVREAREARGLSQQAFADLVGVGRRFISELENGKPTLELGKVLQVAAATGIDVLARRRR